jgi:hypothetical protein
VRISEAVQPTQARSLDQILPTSDELTGVLGVPGMMGQRVQGDADMLLAGVGPADATPVDCVSPAYRLQKVVYQSVPLQAVATQSWMGGSIDGPPASGFFGVVQFATPADAQAFFAAEADKWHRCNGQSLVLNQPDRGAQATSRISDVVVDDALVSAVVLNNAGSVTQRAMGVSADCVVDVEISDPNGAGGAPGAVGVANAMLRKVGTA